VALQFQLKPLIQQQRMEIFRALVQAQDRGVAVAESRKAACQEHGLSDVQLRRIEQEGLADGWPPL
jgi:hypothetical protein